MKNLSDKTYLGTWLTSHKLEYLFTDRAKERISIRRLKKGEVVLYDGDDIVDMSIVLEGTLKVVPSSSEGKTTLIDYIGEGEVFGDIEFFCKRKSIHTVIATGKVTLLQISYHVIERELKDYAPFLLFMCHKFSEKMCNSSISHSKQLLMSTKVQICKYIMEAADKHKKSTIPIKHTEVAQILGNSDRHVRRIMVELMDEGVIEKHSRGYITILDVNELQNIIETV